jgi:Zn-dependent metalloprotease
MNRMTTGLGFGVLLAVVVAGGQSITAVGAPSPVSSLSAESSPFPVSSPFAAATASRASSPSRSRALRMAAEQSDAASSGQLLRLGAGQKLVVKDVIADPNGWTHVRYDRTFDGLRVIGGDLVSHRDRRVRSRASAGTARTR